MFVRWCHLANVEQLLKIYKVFKQLHLDYVEFIIKIQREKLRENKNQTILDGHNKIALSFSHTLMFWNVCLPVLFCLLGFTHDIVFFPVFHFGFKRGKYIYVYIFLKSTWNTYFFTSVSSKLKNLLSTAFSRSRIC